MIENISLIGLTCPACDKVGTQELIEYGDWQVGKKRRVRVDTQCTSCHEVHYYTPLLPIGEPVVIRQGDLLVIPF